MPKTSYAFIYLLVDIVLAIIIWFSKKQKKDIEKYTTVILTEAFSITFCYTLILWTNNVDIIFSLYGVYFACFSWMCFGILNFSIAYTGLMDRYIKYKKIVFIFVCIDSVSQILNCVFKHSFDAVFVTDVYQDIYMQYVAKSFMNFHLGFCYVMMFVAFAVLIYKCIVSPPAYRIQYFPVLNVLFIIALINALFVFTNLLLDFSILAYGIGSAILMYYVYLYLPREMLIHMSSKILKDLGSSIIVFDINGNCIYQNETLKQLFHSHFKNITEAFEFFELDIPESNSKSPVRHNKNIKFGNRQYRLQYNYIYQNQENDDRVIGSYIITSDITSEMEALAKREYQATHDELTGLYNIHFFVEEARKMMGRNPNEEYCMAMTNIYQFKLYNEVFGREAGDELIMQMAEQFKIQFPTDHIVYARWIDDRFVMCVPAKLCTEELIQKYHVNEPIVRDNFKVMNYIGIYHIASKDESVSTMLERAAIALNTVKGTSKFFAFFDDKMREDLLWENEMMTMFPEALKANEFCCYIQPQVSAISNEVVGGEALVRWIKPDGTIISPGKFIPILEKNGMINKLDQYIWDQSCKLAKKMLDLGFEVPISVNISAQDFYHCDLYQVFTELIHKYDIPAKYIRLEITESEMITDQKNQIELITRLQKEGFVFEMDDFGSGYSSLNTLKEIPVNIIKLDMNFIKGAENVASKGRWIVEVIIQNARAHHLPVIVEGVELEEQANFLKEIGCEYIQGFLYGKPMPEEDFIEYRRKYGYKEMKI